MLVVDGKMINDVRLEEFFIPEPVHSDLVPSPHFSTKCTSVDRISIGGVIITEHNTNPPSARRSSWTMSDKMSRCDTNYVKSVCTGIDNARSVIWDLFGRVAGELTQLVGRCSERPACNYMTILCGEQPFCTLQINFVN